MEYLTFKLDGDEFAINVLKTREVLDQQTVTRVPRSPKFMLGALNLRGGVVPVIDLRLKFGLPRADATRDSSIIVMEVEVDDETVVVGALVDSVEEVLELSDEQIGPAPRIGTRLNTEFIHGMGKRDEQFLIILDIDRVFSSDELILVQEAADQEEADPEADEAPAS
jgi:purine-binding chemotaxis protein CheW